MGQTASEMYQAQLAADVAHHRQRLVWLTASPPIWSDGSPMDAWMARTLRKQSEECAADPIQGYNSCHCEPRCTWPPEHESKP